MNKKQSLELQQGSIGVIITESPQDCIHFLKQGDLVEVLEEPDIYSFTVHGSQHQNIYPQDIEVIGHIDARWGKSNRSLNER